MVGGGGADRGFARTRSESQLRRIGRISDGKLYLILKCPYTFIAWQSTLVLNYCESTASQSAFVLIDGEEAPNFVAGLADNVGLESTRAARMVSAAVAAMTRSKFCKLGLHFCKEAASTPQTCEKSHHSNAREGCYSPHTLHHCKALEIQGKHSEAMGNLFKICAIHKIFPPEEFPPEMEMVARGLEKHLKVDQREFLMNSLLRVCGDGTRRSVAEALGLRSGYKHGGMGWRDLIHVVGSSEERILKKEKGPDLFSEAQLLMQHKWSPDMPNWHDSILEEIEALSVTQNDCSSD
ncbi:hypothetical protein HAX54_025516 [Datura stramonium]|uniref:Uncharacterized protein n=1 Tax=Datura stramonium TaxID=4076 RepID=A0ABS8RMB0_DATST|nr:hypothetical protein [Datura stramonium]